MTSQVWYLFTGGDANHDCTWPNRTCGAKAVVFRFGYWLCAPHAGVAARRINFAKRKAGWSDLNEARLT